MNKKLVLVALATITTLGVSACSLGEITSVPPTPTTSQTPTPTTTSVAPSTSVTPTTSSAPSSTTTSSTPSSTTSSEPTTTSEEASVVITPNQETMKIKIGSEVSIVEYITITKTDGSKVSTTDAAVNLTTDDETMLSFSNQGKKAVLIQALKVGNCNLTVTSKKYPSVSVTMPVIVEDSFFDYNISKIDTSVDDISKEMPASRDTNGGELTVNTISGADAYMRNRKLTRFYFETSIKVLTWDPSDLYPKFGIIMADMEGSSPTYNACAAFFNTECDTSSKYYNWTDLGFVEREGAGNWGWNPDVKDNQARHADKIAHINPGSDTVKIGVYRDGVDFHMFVNDAYAKSMKGLNSLFKDETTADMPLNIGVFTFAGSCKFYDYKLVEDQAGLDAKAAQCGSDYVTTWDPKNP